METNFKTGRYREFIIDTARTFALLASVEHYLRHYIFINLQRPTMFHPINRVRDRFIPFDYLYIPVE